MSQCLSTAPAPRIGLLSTAQVGAVTAVEITFIGDVFDDLRKRYGFTPDKTVIGGFSIGASVPWRISFEMRVSTPDPTDHWLKVHSRASQSQSGKYLGSIVLKPFDDRCDRAK